MRLLFLGELEAVVLKEETQRVAYCLVSAVVHASLDELVQEPHIPLGQPDGDSFSLTFFGHIQHA